MENNSTYTQVINEKTGEIKYVPTSPPPRPAGGGGHEPTKGSGYKSHFESRIGAPTDFKLDPKLTKVLQAIEENNKRLRYNKRLQTGKLDVKRLVAYKTSDRLFKKKAIKDYDYQFNFLLDTSGSMRHEDSSGETRLKVAIESVVKTVRSLEELGLPASVWGMNQRIHLAKPFSLRLSDDDGLEEFMDIVRENFCGVFDHDGETISNLGGTAEYIAYNEAIAYANAMAKSPKTVNVFIILSDGEPGCDDSLHEIEVQVGDNVKRVGHDPEKDEAGYLSRFWQRNTQARAFGIGIQSVARQIPNNKRINRIGDLPEVMGKLLQEIML